MIRTIQTYKAHSRRIFEIEYSDLKWDPVIVRMFVTDISAETFKKMNALVQPTLENRSGGVIFKAVKK